MDVGQRDIDSIKPYERNPRVNNQAVKAVVASIKEFGFRQPIVVDDAGIIIVGHVRWKAAKKLGLAEVPVHVATGLTAEQVKAYRIADNQTGDIATWDYDSLAAQLLELQGTKYDLSSTGFDPPHLERLLRQAKSALEGVDDLPAESAETVSRPGDIWHLGRHRLLCADSTSEDAPSAIGFNASHLVVADPPFELARTAVLQASFPAGARDVILLVGTAPKIVFTLGQDTPLPLRFSMVVRKASPFLLRGSAGKRYPAIGHFHLVFFSDASTARCQVRKGPRDFVPTWIKEEWDGEVSRKRFGWGKPVKLISTLLSYYPDYRSVYDPFCGSGTTIVAAELLGLTCRAVEIEPQYVDLAVERYQELTGRGAKLYRAGRKVGSFTRKTQT